LTALDISTPPGQEDFQYIGQEKEREVLRSERTIKSKGGRIR
jgi:hypothetical protein